MDKSLEDEISELIADGIIAKDLTPLKCYDCHSKNLVEGKSFYDYDLHMKIEYEVVCGDCGKRNGYWAYGGWTI